MEFKMVYRFTVWFACVLCLTLGFPHGGRVVPVNKRSDFSMYDNQFFNVGDSTLDNEVTDCALVRHQYARGFIRLREFLERMQGCGIKGKMDNIAGIAAATKDAIDFPDNTPAAPQNPAVKAASFKPHPIAQVLDNTNQQKPQIAAYNNEGLNNNQAQKSVQPNQYFNNFGFFSQENGPLSYSANPAPTAVQAPAVRKLISRKNMDIPQAQALKNLSGSKNRKWPDPQRYYSEQTAAMTQANIAPAVTAGQPIVRPNPFPLAFHQQVQVTSASHPSQPQAFQPANPDLNIIKNTQKLAKQVSHVQAGKMRDDINGDQLENEQVQDEADEATIDNQESDPLPSETSFTYNPNLEDEETPKDADAIAKAENTAVNGLPNHPNKPASMNSVPGEGTHSSNYIPADGPSVTANKPATPTAVKVASQKPVIPQKSQSVQTSQNSSKVQAALKELNGPSTLKTQSGKASQNSPNIQKTQSTPKADKPALPENLAGAIEGDDINGSSDNSKLNEFLKPESGSENKQDNTADKQPSAAQDQQPAAPESTKKPGNLAINLDVLKNRISSSRDVGFLKRMLTLIRKITHHKDFHKLGGMQRNAIMQAGMAVHNAVASKGDDLNQRSSIQPQPKNWYPGQYSAQGYYTPQYASAVQRSFIQQNPPNWKPGEYTYNGYNAYASPQGVNYAYPSYQAGAQYNPPHWSPGEYTKKSSTPPQQQQQQQQQLAKPVKPQVQKFTKKFQIERNQYAQAQAQSHRPAAAYRPPYASLGSLSFGLYNGNTP